MAWWSAASAAASFVLLMLAGCAADAPPLASTEPTGPVLQATATTGVLRGVVVDQAIRPLANVSVVARGPASAERTATTDADGLFGMADLAPGTWFVSASKLAYTEVQQSTEVVAGVSDPRILKLQMQFLPSQAPFATQVKYDGFAELIIPGANVGAIGNIYTCLVARAAGQPCSNVTSDQSVIYVHGPVMDQARIPDFAQMELVWESTQAVTDWLSLRITAHGPEDGASVDERRASALGTSPLVHSANVTVNTEWELGTEQGWAIEVFSGGNELSCGGLPVRACVGFVISQRLTFFFNFFYAYTPPEGWMFTGDGTYPPPT